MSRTRERHGRGMRGPGVVPQVPGRPVLRTRRERFDDLVLGIVAEIDERWQHRLGTVEYAVEEMPLVPDGWDENSVPLAGLVPAREGRPTRLVLFRRPLEHRAESRTDLEAIVLTVVVEQVADLLGIDPEQVDDRYESED